MASHPSLPCAVDEPGERVAKKEGAMQEAIASLRYIAKTIDKVSRLSPEFDPCHWALRVEEVIRERDEFQFLVGVAGDTGMGKSSLLNALVSETVDLAPSSQNGACTAAVCCFLHPGPDSDDTTPTYAARIHIKSKETVDEELLKFFQEYSDFFERAQLYGDKDPSTSYERARLNEQVDIIHRWSGLTKERLEQLGSTNQVSEITSTCAQREQLFYLKQPQKSRVISISNQDGRKFLQEIKPYVGTSGRSSGPLRWPLVEKTEIFIHSDLLRGGIVLVDLPGEMDALDTRSQVARRYYNKLDGLMVVTPGDRAFDNKTAMEIIREDHIMDMEADGMFHENNICVVVSKVDLMDWRNFVETEYSYEDISPDFEQLFEDLTAKEDERENIEQLIVQLGSESGDGRGDERQSLLIRKIKVEDESALLDSTCLKRCIDARNNDIQLNFEKYFNDIRNSSRAPNSTEISTTIKVIAVSSKAHRGLARGRPESAFRDQASTGIGALKDWIVKSSLRKREEHADTVLHCCQMLFDAIDDWAADKPQVTTPLSKVDRSKALESLDKECKRFKKNLQNAIRLFADTKLEKILAAVELCKNESGADHFSRFFVSHVETFLRDGYAVKLHWSTYAACIRRHGGAFRSSYGARAKQHNWRARTYGLLWKGHAHAWGQAYGPTLDGEVKKLKAKLHGRLRNHGKIITETEGLDLPAGVQSAMRSNALRVENVFTNYVYRVQKAIRDHCAVARDTKTESSAFLAAEMHEAYETANRITGKGKLKGQVDTMSSFASKLKDTIFDAVSGKVDDRLKQERLRLKKRLLGETKATADEITKMEKKICTSYGKLPQKIACGPEEERFRSKVSQQVREWNDFWAGLKAHFPRAEFIIDDSSDCESEKESDGSSKKKKASAKKRLTETNSTGSRKASKGESTATAQERWTGTTSSGPRKASEDVSKASKANSAPKSTGGSDSDGVSIKKEPGDAA